MKKFNLIIILGIFIQLFSVTLDGYAFLEGETDHSGIEVILQKVAPDTNFRDTLFTDAAGYYSGIVDIGWYEAYYTSEDYWFVEDSILNINGYADISLDDITLMQETSLYGLIWGVLTAGEYEVSGSITVADGDSLILEPGVKLKFNSGTELQINGYLKAQGTEVDSVKFTSVDNDWLGVYFYGADAGSFLDYCLVENSGHIGIHSKVSNINITNCTIMNNTISNGYGGGLHLDGGNYIISNSLIVTNGYSNGIYNTSARGGGIYCRVLGDLEINNCSITGNYAATYGGGIYIASANGESNIYNCNISNNSAVSQGGGIYASNGNVTRVLNISNSIIENNSAWDGGGIYTFGYSGEIANSIIFNNSYEGIYSESCGNLKFTNLTIYDNFSQGIYIKPYSLDYLPQISNCIISGNDKGIECESFVPLFKNNNVWGNDSGNLFGTGDYVGVYVTTNANADSCDTYENISLDPEFLDEWNGDLYLTSGSPCIDAGSNSIEGYEFPIGDLDDNYRLWDGDGNGSVIVDMGAYEYDSHSTSIQNSEVRIQKYTLSQNYPNPFNPETTISYSLINNAQVNLRVYNIAGREVCDLVNSKQNKGSHVVKFDGSMLTSGIYFYQLTVDGLRVESRKMMLLK